MADPEERVRVIRTLIMYGPRGWIDATLARCAVSPDRPMKFVGQGIEETSRAILSEDGKLLEVRRG